MGRLERLLSLAWESGAVPLVLLTKSDMVTDSRLIADDVAGVAPGVDVMCTSTVTGQGIDGLRARLEGHLTLALLGSSGHGKSSLTNALVGADVLTTRRIRADGRGRHTTVRRELVVLPTGGAVVDTPGLRGIGLLDTRDGLSATFPDVAELARLCRFSDCSHRTEPGCAVLEAIDGGALAVRRLSSWRMLKREQARMAARTDARLRAELDKERKHLSKQARATMRNRP
jgi:ribosome biogenesis GTPase